MTVYAGRVACVVNDLLPFAAFTAFDCKNKFQVKNAMGQQVYYAAEGEEGVGRERERERERESARERQRR